MPSPQRQIPEIAYADAWYFRNKYFTSPKTRDQPALPGLQPPSRRGGGRAPVVRAWRVPVPGQHRPGPGKAPGPPPGSHVAVHLPRLTAPHAAAIQFSPARSGSRRGLRREGSAVRAGRTAPAQPRRGSLGPQPCIVSRGGGRPPPSDEVSEK